MKREDLETWLVKMRPELVRFLHRHGGAALRFETSEDLAQGVVLRALESEATVNADDERARMAWLYAVARRHVIDRSRHWRALKRNSGSLLRLSGSSDATTDPRAVPEPAIAVTGPSTFASRREQLVLAVQALDLLYERDRELLRGYCEGRSIQEDADALGLEYDAARRARSRALERFQKAYRALSL